MTKETTAKLLPVGFYDLLFDEAEKNHENINTALSAFLKAGYRLVKTPLVEFEDNFSACETRNAFRATDVISGKNLIFRNDITPQISRLLNTRLQNETLPLKLCYVGDVLCAKSEDLYADRQQTQVGVEIIGCDTKESEFEIIEAALSALKALQIKNLLIEFSLPEFLDIFLSEINAEKKAELRTAVMAKNISAIRNLDPKNAEIISKITLSNGGLENLIAEISAETKSQKISETLKTAQKIAEFLTKNFPEIAVRFDLFGDQDSSYHREVAFDIFCTNFSYAIARGGKYKIDANGKTLDAVGSTIYMNHLRKIK